MSVYTCYDMIPGCRAGKPEAWLYFVRRFVPGLRWLVRRYGGAEEQLLALLASLRPFPGFVPQPERELVAALRPRVIEATGWRGGAEGSLDLESFNAALEPLTVLERQVVWFDILAYDVADSARLCRIAPETAGKIRERALELLRGGLDHWTADIIARNRGSLAEEARSAAPSDPVELRRYLEIIDGRMTWQNRVPIEQALAASWFEVDVFCRVREADAAMREAAPMDDAALLPYYTLFGVAPPKPPVWKRLLGAR